MIIFANVNQLQGLLESAQKAHHEAEKRLPKHNWAQWYAAYISARESTEASGLSNPKMAERFADQAILEHVVSDPHSGSAF